MAVAQNFVSVSRRPPDIEDYIDMFRRHRSWLLGPMFAGLVVSVVVGFFYPNTYVSSAVLRVTPQQISDWLVPTVVNMQMQQRLQQLQQEILSRGSLSELITRPALDLYKAERAAAAHGRYRHRYAQQGDPDSAGGGEPGTAYVGIYHFLRVPGSFQGPGGGARTGHQVYRAKRDGAA